MNPLSRLSAPLLLLSAAISAQKTEPGLRPRELFYHPPPPPPAVTAPKPTPKLAPPGKPVKPAAVVPLVLRYSVLRRIEENRFTEVSPDTVFQTGDAVKLQVEVNERAYLYVIAQGTSGSWDVVFPRPDHGETKHIVERGEKQEVPRGRPWTLEEPRGAEKIFLLVSRQPDQELDRFIQSRYSADRTTTSQRPGGGLPQAEVARLQSKAASRDLVYEKGETNGQDPAVYIMSKATGRPATVTTNVSLQH